MQHKTQDFFFIQIYDIIVTLINEISSYRVDLGGPIVIHPTCINHQRCLLPPHHDIIPRLGSKHLILIKS